MEVGGGGGGGGREIIYLSLHCHQQNDFCIQMGSDESHFNVQSLKTVSTDHSVSRERRAEAESTEVPPLTSLKPVLNWAICLLANLVGSIRRT